MASTIILSDNGASSGSAGLKTTGGNDGVLILQTTTSGGTATNALTVDNLQNVGLGLTPSSWQSTSKAYEIGSGGTSQGAWGITASGYMDIFRNAYISSGNAIYKYNGPAQQYRQSADGSHSWGVAPSGTAGGTISFTQVLAVDKDKSLALQGATSATGTGITFPATQNASSNAKTLDDYEEGTFTPVLTADGGSGWTYSTQVGKYTKIGNVVHIAYVLGLSSKGTMSGSFYLSGLPFPVEDVYSSGEPWAIDFALVNGLSTSVVSLTGWANNNSTLMQVRKQTAAATSWGNSYLDVVDIGTSFYIQCSCTYRT